MDYYTWNPGPGTYKPKIGLTTTQGAIYSLGIKLKTKDGDNLPGPGTYNAGIVDRREPTYTIQGRHDAALADGKPGAGTYDPSIKLTKREEPHFTLGPKIDISFETSNPGPGTYKPKKVGQKPAFTLGKRFNAEIDQNIPGPGTYQRPYVNWYKPGFTLGKRFPAEPMDQNPAPGTYNPRIPRVVWRKDGFTLAKRLPQDDDLGYPGPGNYNDQYRGKPPAYTIATRFVSRPTFVYPGAGEYSPVFVRGPPGYSLAGRNDIFHDDGFPGPGAYSPLLPKRPGHIIATKLVDQPAFNVPGAGTYFNPKLDKWCGPAYSLAPRGLGDPVNKNPGPGTYNAVPVRGKGCKIGTKLDDPDWKVVPGPGRYNLRGKPTSEGRAFTIAERFRQKPRPGERGYIEPPPKVF